MTNRIIDIISNIKVVGWITIIVSSGLLYYCANSLLAAYLINQNIPSQVNTGQVSDFDQMLTEITFYIFLTSLLDILGISIGRGVIKIQRWAVRAFHFFSIVIGLSILAGILYMVATINYVNNEPANRILKVQTMSWGTAGLLITWLITRANLLLFRKEYRIELK